MFKDIAYLHEFKNVYKQVPDLLDLAGTLAGGYIIIVLDHVFSHFMVYILMAVSTPLEGFKQPTLFG